MKRLLFLSTLIVYVFACCPLSATEKPPTPVAELPTAQPPTAPPVPTDTPAPIAQVTTMIATITATPTTTDTPTNTPTIKPTDTPTSVPPTPTPLPFEPEMILIPAGEFLMGSDPGAWMAYDREQPQHTLYLPGYYLAKTEVTNVQYAAFVEATGHAPPGHWEGGKPPGGKEDHPVVNVSWYDAVAYCDWLAEVTGKPHRLPSEAEWEKAARGGLQIPDSKTQDPSELIDNPNPDRIYPWGDEFDPRKANLYIWDEWAGGTTPVWDEWAGGTTPVGIYPGGASPYGIMDMSGNVWEWCSSLFQDYPYDPNDGREDLEAEGRRVLRGGSWFDLDAWSSRCSFRYGLHPALFDGDVGFRVVVSAALSP